MDCFGCMRWCLVLLFLSSQSLEFFPPPLSDSAHHLPSYHGISSSCPTICRFDVLFRSSMLWCYAIRVGFSSFLPYLIVSLSLLVCTLISCCWLVVVVSVVCCIVVSLFVCWSVSMRERGGVCVRSCV
jgi:hypothetical protein